ncbi:MAG: leucyl aminopeptidase [Rhizobiaceae bacterium]|nr:leucyl aminopeptidase [Rhizobiaceae bacterium]
MMPTIKFTAAAMPAKGTLVVFADGDNKLGAAGNALDKSGALTKAIKAAGFKGGFGKTLDILTPRDSDLDRMIVVGLGDVKKLTEFHWLRLGGRIRASVAGNVKVAVMVELPQGEGKKSPSVGAKNCLDLGVGARLASYRFDRYKTKKRSRSKPQTLTLHAKSASAAKKLWDGQEGVSDGVMLARDLVNEPANILTPKDFAKRAMQLKKLGCAVEVLDEKAMKALKMEALLGVARGSRNPPRMAIIQWKGGASKERPVAFVGKGVTFDTGGISLKPAGGMEDMKGDMGGAAAVAGLMHALAARKAKVNAVGIIAMVENMPDGDAQRPGDIVKSMSGQTIEVLNTDAEGRLVLADALWHCNKKFKPKFMINLATLTGAILVALGNQHAGLFSNNDELSEQLSAAGLDTNEKVWRMPLTPEYDKLIDSKNADMKNIGGRYAGSITAGQFLQRFVGKTPWAHLDVAGTAMASPQTEINKSWASGFGVRLLDRLVADNYES